MSEALRRPIRRNPRMGHAVGRTARCFTQQTYSPERDVFKLVRILRMVATTVSRVRAAALRKRCLSLAKTCSIGFRSGEYLGRKNSFAPAERMARRTALPLWLPRLSMITTSPGLSVGASAFST